MEYTSTLETLEGFSSALASVYDTPSWSLGDTSTPLLKVKESHELLMVVKKAPSSLLVDF